MNTQEQSDNQNNQNQNDNLIPYPAGDIYHDFKQDDSEEKFDYLKAKYMFRFPFTITAIKWGISLGTFFALHSYIKQRSLANSLNWFVWGTIMSGLPIWGFFMFKYSFYTMTIRKFEIDQIQQIEDNFIMKNYFLSKLGNVTNENQVNEEELIKKVEAEQIKEFKRNSQLNDLIDENDLKEFEFNIIQEDLKQNK